MSSASHTAVIKVSINEVWRVFNDFKNIYQWHHMVESSRLTSSNNEGLGATRIIQMYGSVKEVTEKVVEYENGKFLKMEFLNHGMPVKKIEAEFRTKQVSDSATEVTVTMNQDLKFGLFGKFLHALFMKRMIQKSQRGILDGLEKHILTGKMIGKDGNRDI